MDTGYINKRVEEIISNGDPEHMHSRLDDLFLEFIETIADGKCHDPEACAEALRTGSEKIHDEADWWAYA